MRRGIFELDQTFWKLLVSDEIAENLRAFHISPLFKDVDLFNHWYTVERSFIQSAILCSSFDLQLPIVPTHWWEISHISMGSAFSRKQFYSLVRMVSASVMVKQPCVWPMGNGRLLFRSAVCSQEFRESFLLWPVVFDCILEWGSGQSGGGGGGGGSVPKVCRSTHAWSASFDFLWECIDMRSISTFIHIFVF